MQPPPGFEIRFSAGECGNSGWHARFERLLDHPMDLNVVLSFDENRPVWIEAHRVEAMTVNLS